jgi:hypothetical protein
MEEAAARRQAEGAAREAARLKAISEDHVNIQTTGLTVPLTLPGHLNPPAIN